MFREGGTDGCWGAHIESQALCPLQSLRDPYPSLQVLAPSSDLAFFFSFSLLSNPWGEAGIS